MAENYADAVRLDGKGFVVLGAGGGGIGDETCHALSQVGAKVLCVDFKKEEAERVAKAVGGHPVVADVTKREDVVRVFSEAKSRFGSSLVGVVDVIGVANSVPITEFNDDQLKWQFDIVLRHVILALQIGAPMIAENGGGAMTFIGSISGITSVPNQTMYGTAKAAVHHAVRTAAHEFAPKGVRINAIAPGFVRTPRLVKMVPAETWQQIADANPMRRPAEPADIARAALFLSSDLARYVTGNVLTLDGGLNNIAALPAYIRNKT